MSEDDRAKWDDRYRKRDYVPRREPSPLVESAVRIIPPGRALVLACGTGRNAVHLARAGFEVEAVDISATAIGKGRSMAVALGVDVDWRVADIDTLHFDSAGYDLITMVRYLNRAIWPRVFDAVRPNGWLLVVQHFRTRRRVLGPKDPAFRLGPGELLDAFPGLRIVEYTEVVQRDPEREEPSATASLLGCKGDPGW